jgi:hypothetical protein
MVDISDELLTDDERADLERVTAGVVALLPDTTEELAGPCEAAAMEAYVSGRVAGLCREGALELASEAAREVMVESTTA